MSLTDAQRELLEDKFMIWDRASREGSMELRDYNRRAADALKAALALASGAETAQARAQALQGQLDRAVEVMRPFGDAAKNSEVSGYPLSHFVGAVEFEGVVAFLASLPQGQESDVNTPT